MKTKMKILTSMLLVFVVLSTSSVVFAAPTKGTTCQYAVTGHIDNRDKGIGASMFMAVKGTLTLGTPDYDSGGWSGWRDEDRGWDNQGGGRDWWFR